MPGLDRVMFAQEFPFDGSLQTSELHVRVLCAEGEPETVRKPNTVSGTGEASVH